MVDKFNKLSGGKKAGVIAGIFVFLFIVVGMTAPATENLSETDKDVQTSQQKTIDLTEKQTIDTTETKTETKTESVAYESSTKNDSSIEKGRTIKSVTGVAGERTITYEVTYTNGQETSRKEISNDITKAPINEVTLIGTKAPYVAPAPAPRASSCDPNYSGGCVPNVSGDLDCPDIRFMVTVIGNDRHRFDGDKDGYGCESYN
jgi:hypothetical protein